MNEYYVDEIDDDFDEEDEDLIGYEDWNNLNYKEDKNGNVIWNEMSYNKMKDKRKFVDEEVDE